MPLVADSISFYNLEAAALQYTHIPIQGWVYVCVYAAAADAVMHFIVGTSTLSQIIP